VPQGLLVLPGKYEVRLKVNGQTVTQPLTVAMDPRVQVAPADLAAQHGFYKEIAQVLDVATSAQEKIDTVADRLKSLDQELAGRDALRETTRRLAAEVGSSKESVDTAAEALTAQTTDIEACDCAPTAPQREVVATYRKELDAALAKWQALASGALSDLDRQVRAAGLTAVVP
jgi:chromosome segregation ATPase